MGVSKTLVVGSTPTVPVNAGFPLSAEVEERFWAKVDRSGGPGACWPWLAVLDPSGYGAFKLNGKKVNSNRVAFTIANGRPPAPGMVAAHAPIVCHNRACCNPEHIRETTQRENVLDQALDGTTTYDLATAASIAERLSRTRCLRGHPLYGENLYVAPGGSRKCRECRREWKRARRVMETGRGTPV